MVSYYIKGLFLLLLVFLQQLFSVLEFLNLKNFINDSLNKKINDLILKFEMQISDLKQENIVKEMA